MAADRDMKYLARFYRCERLIDEWIGIGDPDTLLATHNRYYPRMAADRVVVEPRHNQAEENNG